MASMRIYGIQYTGGGIPDDPEVFPQKHDADVVWKKKWNDFIDINDGYPLDLNDEPVTDPLTVDYFSDEEGSSEWRRWEVECA
jgi:hypothetical protein